MDGSKMSKSKGNVVSPEEIIGRFGADTARLFILFAAPPERDLEWNDQGVEGCFRFLNRVWRLVAQYGQLFESNGEAVSLTKDKHFTELDISAKEMRRQTHLSIQRVTSDIGVRFNFNTAISAIMELVNALYLYKEQEGANLGVAQEAVESIVLLLAPFAPHIAEELWSGLGCSGSVHAQGWPEVDDEALIQEEITIILQVNSKVRDRIQVPALISSQELEAKVLALKKLPEWTRGKPIVKVIIVPGKLVNLVLKG